jgi:hypothetical protein
MIMSAARNGRASRKYKKKAMALKSKIFKTGT